MISIESPRKYASYQSLSKLSAFAPAVGTLPFYGIVGYETQAAILREVWVSKRPTLKEGSQGQEVKNLQELLNGTGEIPQGQFGTIKVDGVFGANTKAAIIKFQKSTDIAADGVVGLKTWKQLSFRKSYDMSPEEIVLNGIFNLA